MKSRDEAIIFNSFEDLPLSVYSLGSTLATRTGSWKYMRPVYQNKTAPCNAGCPTGNDIEAIMYFVGQNNLAAAWERLMWENPFPAVTGRVCYHPCESHCNRRHFDAALAIHCLERFVGDYGLHTGRRVLPVSEKIDSRVAVVGGGPAGLATAYHLARLGYDVTVFEAKPEPGGVLRYGIPEYRLPKDILRQEIARIDDLGVHIRTGVAIGKNIPFAELQSYDAIFLATGVGKSRKMAIPGEDLQGVWSGLEFLEQRNVGEKVALGATVAVIGGGNTAMDAARSAVRLGKKVKILYRRSRSEMPAIAEEIDEALTEGIELLTLVAPVRMLENNGKVVGLELQRMQLAEPDASGRRRPEPISGSNFRIDIDTVITAVGEQPDFSFLPKKLQENKNFITIDQVGQTEQAAVFAGGDIVDQPHTVVDAIASGKRAAMAIDMFLSGFDLTTSLDKIRLGDRDSLSMRRYVLGHNLRENVDNRQVVEFNAINTAYFTPMSRNVMPERDVKRRLKEFAEVNMGFTEAMATAEAARCFNCGVCNQCDNCYVFCPDLAIRRNGASQPYVIDYDYCKGCGICANECPRNAISMVKEGSGR